MGRKVGIADVARVAGVSTATVDRVLNGRGGVRREKEERIIAVARQLGMDRALELRPSRTLRIGVLIQAPRNPFHALLRQGLDHAAQLYSGLNLQLLFVHLDPKDPAGAATRIAAMSGQRDGLILSAPDHPQITAAVREFSRRAPVVTLVSDLEQSGRQVFIGPDDFRGGRAAADLMGLFLRPEGGDVIMVAGGLGLAGQRAREAGFRSLIAERYPDLRLIRTLETDEDPEAAGRLVEQALRQNPQIRGIYHCSTGASQIVAALERMGRSEIAVITHELIANRRQLLRERRLSAVIDQKPLMEARLAIEAMARLLGRLPGKAESVITEIQIFMPEAI